MSTRIRYDSHIEPNTSFLDLQPLNGPDGKPLGATYAITYTIEVLSKSTEDFAPFALCTGDPDFPPGKPEGASSLPDVGRHQEGVPHQAGSAEVTEADVQLRLAFASAARAGHQA